jgi:hypothetical protein
LCVTDKPVTTDVLRSVASTGTASELAYLRGGRGRGRCGRDFVAAGDFMAVQATPAVVAAKASVDSAGIAVIHWRASAPVTAELAVSTAFVIRLTRELLAILLASPACAGAIAHVDDAAIERVRRVVIDKRTGVATRTDDFGEDAEIPGALVAGTLPRHGANPARATDLRIGETAVGVGVRVLRIAPLTRIAHRAGIGGCGRGRFRA